MISLWDRNVQNGQSSLDDNVQHTLPKTQQCSKVFNAIIIMYLNFTKRIIHSLPFKGLGLLLCTIRFNTKKFYILFTACVNASLAPVKFETPGSLYNMDMQAKKR